MKAHEVIKNHIEKKGIKPSFIADETGMSRELLRRSLDGKRTLKADEFVKICTLLSLDLTDFEKMEDGKASA
ncbi:helix-turn-helix domain-containing protein [Murimonas intestini]|uniref:Cro/C1-type helix-turn-helix DNA-binding protein n=1 Tax=Murimonas intestini TaxID=1337051 RepID=A0AB73SZI5_9FIRM|nr:helix-turn-helix domain-containing protein [Murimonas intestini]MCR1842793.1 helix-turn-helix domain-containing protein [Murimonas intestini]MCR1867868.1 helix-turn-helix domain-containing protein [Murimonas intestini]MCR1885219.1 helix-turn-helix domain-containing protein [Murimonas intestini]